MNKQGLIVAGVFALGMAWAGGAAAQDNVLNVVHYGGTPGKQMRSYCFDAAEKALGFKIVDQSRTDYAKIKAMVQSGNIEWDVALVNRLLVYRGAQEGLWEEIDYNLIDPKVNGPLEPLKHSVAYLTYSQGLGYSTEQWKDKAKAPTGWKDFWDIKNFPGPRSMDNRVRYSLEAALVADGVAPEKLYPLDVERAFRKLDEIKPHIRVWANPPVQGLELIASGEVVMAMTAHQEVAAAQAKKVPAQFVWNSSLYIPNDWSVVKGTKKKAMAMQMIKFCTGPAPEAEMARQSLFGPPNPEAVKLLTEAEAATLPTAPQNLKGAAYFDSVWWGDNEEKLIERWNAWLLKK
jgi:putative spermidine/putrescine transport system substrate-binding protein